MSNIRLFNYLFLSLLGVPVFECQVRVCLPGQEEPQTDQLDCAVQTQAQEGPVCKYNPVYEFIIYICLQGDWSENVAIFPWQTDFVGPAVNCCVDTGHLWNR